MLLTGPARSRRRRCGCRTTVAPSSGRASRRARQAAPTLLPRPAAGRDAACAAPAASRAVGVWTNALPDASSWLPAASTTAAVARRSDCPAALPTHRHAARRRRRRAHRPAADSIDRPWPRRGRRPAPRRSVVDLTRMPEMRPPRSPVGDDGDPFARRAPAGRRSRLPGTRARSDTPVGQGRPTRHRCRVRGGSRRRRGATARPSPV